MLEQRVRSKFAPDSSVQFKCFENQRREVPLNYEKSSIRIGFIFDDWNKRCCLSLY